MKSVHAARCCLLFSLCWATTAAAQTPASSPQETRRAGLLQQATRARAQQNWVEVVRLLREAIELRPTDSVRLGLAGALQELGRHQEAAVYASQCIRTLSAEARPSAEQQTLLRACRRLLDDSSAHIATVTVRATLQGWQRAALEVDGERIEGFTLGEPVYLTPGPRRLRLLGSAPYLDWTATAERTEMLTAGSSPSFDMELVDNRPRPNEVSDAPSAPTPVEPLPRVQISFGAGIGFAFLSGRPAYAQQRVLVDSMGRRVATTCGNYVCPLEVDPGFEPTFYLNPIITFNLSRRLSFSATVRFQFDSAGWSIEPTTSSGDARSNPYANLLLGIRTQFALSQQGWASRGLIPYVLIGGGIGQIEPKPSLPPNVTRPVAHVLSGFGNVHAGAGFQYHFDRTGFYTDMSIVTQFMFPTFLFDVDLTGSLGLRF